jgi:hypothetical protein
MGGHGRRRQAGRDRHVRHRRDLPPHFGGRLRRQPCRSAVLRGPPSVLTQRQPQQLLGLLGHRHHQQHRSPNLRLQPQRQHADCDATEGAFVDANTPTVVSGPASFVIEEKQLRSLVHRQDAIEITGKILDETWQAAAPPARPQERHHSSSKTEQMVQRTSRSGCRAAHPGSCANTTASRRRHRATSGATR